ncbi:Testis-expressed sequence 2 protein [Pleurostoma richardsiae]|uniref:Testis-expressed sequence 2 protein n=1 Tax=Pleurostoma richardsiae TaxID=41990 RepID=A0AA38S996_9PEZI|nr:Testis-expressed sequence 2 protein [Pleurostoma richardsiae]
MGGWSAFLFAYLLGGITFIPLVLITVFLHAYYFFPYREDTEANQNNDKDDIVQPGDDLGPLEAVQKELKNEGKLKASTDPEPEVAAGYFAVCREYTPMGINAKPIERSTPVGSTTVAAPSPSVYQTMYRSIFDRKQTSSPLDNKSVSQRPKKAGNVFYVVLRHGHLMLFDDDEQLEVRHVISLAHHDVTIYSGGGVTPEGELFIKRNAICLSRRKDGLELAPDSQLSKPFYLFSENCSAKEDFYFALLRNQEENFSAGVKVPSPLQFDVKNMISLVQKLHSSEEHLQTRWLNAVLGRVFLGLHKTADIENIIREKLTKKISRVKRPNFLSNITIRKIDTGESAPYFTNIRLKDLTVEGECGIETDVRYNGNFRLEVAAVARIDLGSRIKTREVNLVLAVVVRKLEGHLLFKIKPPPSNRVWFSFQHMPKIEMTIEPIVSSRQITYNVILRQIENRIKEVIAETLVLPFWDDVPFFRTEHKKWRGGIFEGDDAVRSSTDLETVAAQIGDVEDVSTLEGGGISQPVDLPPREKSYSLPVLEAASTTGLFGRKLGSRGSKTGKPSSSSTSVDSQGLNSPRASSFAKKITLAAVSHVASNAAGAAKRWGLNALQRRTSDANRNGHHAHSEPLDLSKPMGGGRPFPPPGVPLPMPERKSTVVPMPMPKRKPLPPPLPERPHHDERQPEVKRRPVPPPPLPKRRQVQETQPAVNEDGMLVIAAPLTDSEPTTPLTEDHDEYMQPYVEDAEEDDDEDGLHDHVDRVDQEDLPSPDDNETPPAAEVEEPQPSLSPQVAKVADLEGDTEGEDEYSAWMDNMGEDEALASAVTSEGLAH